MELNIEIETEKTKWWINRAPSIFVSRTGKEDVCVYKRSAWGRRQPDGKLYRCVKRFAAESGDTLREYEAALPQITNTWLKQVGFLDV